MSYENSYIDVIDRQCKGKNGYGTKAKAKAKASIRRVPGRLSRQLHAYRCPHCDLFHLGHRR